jgi:hypothetical protein
MRFTFDNGTPRVTRRDLLRLGGAGWLMPHVNSALAADDKGAAGGLALTLGHGMSRFEPKPGHPNSPRGGRRIPNTMCDVLVHLIGRGQSLADSAAAPRLHTEGNATLQLAKRGPDAEADYLKVAGCRIEPGSGANFNSIARDAASGALLRVP